MNVYNLFVWKKNYKGYGLIQPIRAANRKQAAQLAKTDGYNYFRISLRKD